MYRFALFLASASLLIGTASSQVAPVIAWQMALGGTSSEEAHALIQTTDGGFAIAGTTQSDDGDVLGFQGVSDFWIVKLDVDGVLQWQRTFGGSFWDMAFAIVQSSDGGYVAAGRTESDDGDVSGNHGGYDIWVVKLDAAGDLQWQRTPPK